MRYSTYSLGRSIYIIKIIETAQIMSVKGDNLGCAQCNVVFRWEISSFVMSQQNC